MTTAERIRQSIAQEHSIYITNTFLLKVAAELESLTARVRELEAELYERQQWLNNAERNLRGLGYERCTAPACNCSSYHRDAARKQP